MKKRLFIDIERYPEKIYAYGVYDVNALKILEVGLISSVAYAFENEKIKCFSLRNNTPRQLAIKLRNLLSDKKHELLVIGHNSKRFDVKVINAYCAHFHLKPIPASEQEDTLMMHKKVFKLPSNKLRDICTYYGLGKKKDGGGIENDEACMRGDEKAWKQKELYNKYDVFLTRKLYNFLKPRMPKLANVYYDRGRCDACGRRHFIIHQTRRDNKGLYYSLQCKDCGYYQKGERVK